MLSNFSTLNCVSIASTRFVRLLPKQFTTSDVFESSEAMSSTFSVISVKSSLFARVAPSSVMPFNSALTLVIRSINFASNSLDCS